MRRCITTPRHRPKPPTSYAQMQYSTTPPEKTADKKPYRLVVIQLHAALEDHDLLVIFYVHPGKWLQSGRPSTPVGVIPFRSRNTAVLLGRKKMW